MLKTRYISRQSVPLMRWMAANRGRGEQVVRRHAQPSMKCVQHQPGQFAARTSPCTSLCMRSSTSRTMGA